MKARQILNHRRLRLLLPKVVEGARLVVVRSFPGIPEGAQVGDDVTEAVTGLPDFQGILKRGFVRVVLPAAAAIAALPPPASSSSPSSSSSSSAAAAPPSSVSPGLAALRSLGATASKRDLRTALEAAGHTPAIDASRDDMFKARTRLLAAPTSSPPSSPPVPVLVADSDEAAPVETADIDVVSDELEEEAA